MKKYNKVLSICFIIAGIIIILIGSFLIISSKKNIDEGSNLKNLPKPEITGGTRGELGIDKNINEATIDEYLNREDSVYRDMRLLDDPGNYEAIGGDRFLSGYIDGFEVIPLPYIIPVTGLPDEVGDTYTGTTLFYEENGTYIANYDESMEIIEKLFPKDKVIFLMCGGGGYAGMTKNFLVTLGWDENKIYNVGGYWYYEGKHKINVKNEVNGVVSYDFDKVPYHNIEFDKLTKTDKYKNPIIKVKKLKINTSSIELEEGTSFKLNVIVLPNEASNKEIKWISSNNAVATVSDEGSVKAVSEGKTTITAKSISGDKEVTCEVSVIKKYVSTRIVLDDISKDAEEFNMLDPHKLDLEYYNKVELKHDSDGYLIPNEYWDFNGEGYLLNDLGRKENEKYKKEIEQNEKNRVSILNRLIDNKKSFVILYHTKVCDNSSYTVIEGAEKVLKKNKIPYLYLYAPTVASEETIFKSKLDSKLIGGSIIIVKEGNVYASVNPDVDSIKSDEETLNWLSKYIDVN